jgi:hypothetical protein
VPKSKSRAAITKKKAVSKKHKLKPTFANVTVTNGKGAPNPLMVAAGELIHFSNDDNQDYLIQLFVEGADPTHPVVDVLLPALGGLPHDGGSCRARRLRVHLQHQVDSAEENRNHERRNPRHYYYVGQSGDLRGGGRLSGANIG